VAGLQYGCVNSVTKALQFKENLALVLKYFDQLAPIMQEQDGLETNICKYDPNQAGGFTTDRSARRRSSRLHQRPQSREGQRPSSGQPSHRLIESEALEPLGR
jgi:hypothetical protein